MPFDRLRGALASASPTVILGIVLLVAGIGLSFARVTPDQAGDTGALDRALAWVLEQGQRIVLRGDDAGAARQNPFNTVFVGIFREGLSPRQQKLLEGVAGGGATFLGDLISPLGLLSLAGLGIAYFGVARAYDFHFPASPGEDQAPPS
jgi:hypothetical protein